MELAQLHHLVGQALDQAPELSDIIFSTGKPVQIEVQGKLCDLILQPDLGPLLPFQIELLANALIKQRQHLIRELFTAGSCDFAFQLPERERFRVNLFRQRGNLAIVMRKLATSVPDMQTLGVPEAFARMAEEKHGLVLVTGATGSGKSSSLAALLDRINATSSKHIITLEDPIEFLHPHKKGTVNQRELGSDFNSFASGLRAALRQAPKVILVGEIRDRETLSITLEAAETGHLVLGTLHTSDCAQTIYRIAGMFDPSEEKLVRSRLAGNLKCILSQRLMPKVDGKRIAAFEVLVNNLRIQEIIVQGETEEKYFYDALEQGQVYGMHTFDQSLAELFKSGLITEDVAMLNASEKSTLALKLNTIKNEQGQVPLTNKLELDIDYGQDTSF